jgi:hypothetical protein
MGPIGVVMSASHVADGANAFASGGTTNDMPPLVEHSRAVTASTQPIDTVDVVSTRQQRPRGPSGSAHGKAGLRVGSAVGSRVGSRVSSVHVPDVGKHTALVVNEMKSSRSWHSASVASFVHALLPLDVANEQQSPVLACGSEAPGHVAVTAAHVAFAVKVAALSSTLPESRAVHSDASRWSMHTLRPPMASTMQQAPRTGAGGDGVGSRVGSALGSRDGSRVGSRLGSRDGSRVGSTLGSRVGSALGSRVGSALGSRVGSTLGSRVGSALGSRVGSALGSRVGSRDGSRLGSRVGSRVGGAGVGSGVESKHARLTFVPLAFVVTHWHVAHEHAVPLTRPQPATSHAAPSNRH